MAASTPAERGRRHDLREVTLLEWLLVLAVVVVIAAVMTAVIFRILDTKAQAADGCPDGRPARACAR